MEYINGNDRVLFMKIGVNFIPFACLTSNGMEETTDLLQTTTRNTNGLETSTPTMQRFTVSFSGIQTPTIFAANTDVKRITVINLLLLNNSTDAVVRFTISSNDVTLIINKRVTDNEIAIAFNPSYNVRAGVTLEETVANLVNNYNTYNQNGYANFTADFETIVCTMQDSQVYTVEVYNDVPLVGTPIYIDSSIDVSFQQNPAQIASYDRLRIYKRNKTRLTFRIMKGSGFTKYIDEFEGYISSISEESAVNQDSTFSGVITGFAEPRVILAGYYLGTENDFVDDGEGNLIEI